LNTALEGEKSNSSGSEEIRHMAAEYADEGEESFDKDSRSPL
jgi:hypothetical protein